ncbi:MAG: hypothetical protein OHK0012_12130 [Synechococcales cyanobacterium]
MGWLLILGILAGGLGIPTAHAQPSTTPPPVSAPTSQPVSQPVSEILPEAWNRYRQQFIQTDGRVIDREANSRSISEAQAYAMWRAVLMADRDTFDRVWRWGENNLNAGVRPTDSLWAWSWGQRPDQTWGVLDESVASDADLDAALALIFAHRLWGSPPYLERAQTKLRDLWTLCTATVQGERLFLPGEVPLFTNTDVSPERLFSGQGSLALLPTAAPTTPQTYKLNPSYWGAYAFRIFAQVDPDHDWTGLADSSYRLLSRILQASPAGLPPDWLQIEIASGRLLPIQSRPQENHYSFDAFRVWWRLALDARYFSQSPAPQLLKTHLAFLQQRWQSQQQIPAVLTLQGDPVVDYPSTAQYGALYPALVIINPQMAEQIKTQALDPVYQDGIWDSDTAYYTQNLVWMGLSAGELPPSRLLTP